MTPVTDRARQFIRRYKRGELTERELEVSLAVECSVEEISLVYLPQSFRARVDKFRAEWEAGTGWYFTSAGSFRRGPDGKPELFDPGVTG